MKRILFVIWTSLRNYKTNDDATALIRKCIWLIENCPNVIVTIDYYNIFIQTSSNNIKFWNANKWYAWLCRGSVDRNHFDDIMPSRSVSFQFKECLKKHGYNIHQKREELKVSTANIKC